MPQRSGRWLPARLFDGNSFKGFHMADGLTESAPVTAAEPGNPGAGKGHARAALFRHFDRTVAVITEVPAAVLVVAETVILFAGVIARYVFNAPLTWSDELASVLFLWLAMLGAVIALRRGEHMRLTTLVNRLPPKARVWVALFARLAVIAFVLEIVWPAYEYFDSQWDIRTPALEIRDGLRVAAIGV